MREAWAFHPSRFCNTLHILIQTIKFNSVLTKSRPKNCCRQRQSGGKFALNAENLQLGGSFLTGIPFRRGPATARTESCI
jgi:hypothetical protein